jgi:hypothetical protein
MDSFETWCAGQHRVLHKNENRVTGRSKIPQECKNGDFWATGYA